MSADEFEVAESAAYSFGLDPDWMAAERERTPLLRFFAFGHLPPHLAEISAPFCELAWSLCANLEPSAERTVALRKLLESKDAAVRSSL